VAKENSISRAAEALYITQPALSRCIKRLEAEVGTPLIERMNNGIKLTSAGVAFLKELDQAFLHLEQGIHNARKMANTDSPSMAVVCSFEDFDYQVLELLHHDFPDIQISFSILPPDQAYRELLAGKAHFALIPHYNERTDIIYEELLEEEMLISAPEGHPLHGEQKASIKELDGCTCVCNEVVYGWDLVSPVCDDNHITLRLLLSGNDHQAIGHFKGLTDSILFVPISATMNRAPDDNRVMTFPSRVEPPVFHRKICLAYREGKQFSVAERRFVELVRGYYRKLQQDIQAFTKNLYGT
jgi:DNA-binding transcriptional LysR family regulator